MELKVTLIGRVARDAELKYLDSGQAVCNYSVATNPNSKDKDKTTWVKVATWGKRAETDAKYVKKGMLIKVEGPLNADESGGPRAWLNSEGKPQASYEVTGFDVKYLTWPERTDDVEESLDLDDEINLDDQIPF